MLAHGGILVGLKVWKRRLEILSAKLAFHLPAESKNSSCQRAKPKALTS